MINVINSCERARECREKPSTWSLCFSSELNSNDPIQCTHLISYPEVEIRPTHRKTILTETTPINDANQVQHDDEENFIGDLENIFSLSSNRSSPNQLSITIGNRVIIPAIWLPPADNLLPMQWSVSRASHGTRDGWIFPRTKWRWYRLCVL